MKKYNITILPNGNVRIQPILREQTLCRQCTPLMKFPNNSDTLQDNIHNLVYVTPWGSGIAVC